MTLFFLLIHVCLDERQSTDEETGEFKTTLHFDEVFLDDFGLYQCLRDDGAILKAFKLYINGNSSLLLPVSIEERFIHVKSGGPAVIPCRLMNPEDPGSKIGLVNYETNHWLDLDATGISHESPDLGFLIKSGRLPEHNGIIWCNASNPERGITDLLEFRLLFEPGGTGNDGPSPGPETGEDITKPVIELINGTDVHEGDYVILKCTLWIKSHIRDQVKLEWKRGPEVLQQNAESPIEDSNGFTRLPVTLILNSVKERGPYRCTASYSDAYGNILEARSAEVELNVISFDTGYTNHIEWIDDAFNNEIMVPEGTDVKWVIGFTIHRKDYTGYITDPGFEFTKDGATLLPSEKFFPDLRRSSETNLNRFSLTLELFDVNPLDMGKYRLVIFDQGRPFQPKDMNLYIRTTPLVTIRGENNDFGFYSEESLHNFGCDVLSYPINLTR